MLLKGGTMYCENCGKKSDDIDDFVVTSNTVWCKECVEKVDAENTTVEEAPAPENVSDDPDEEMTLTSEDVEEVDISADPPAAT
jgi:hypothetical protein